MFIAPCTDIVLAAPDRPLQCPGFFQLHRGAVYNLKLPFVGIKCQIFKASRPGIVRKLQLQGIQLPLACRGNRICQRPDLCKAQLDSRPKMRSNLPAHARHVNNTNILNRIRTHTVHPHCLDVKHNHTEHGCQNKTGRQKIGRFTPHNQNSLLLHSVSQNPAAPFRPACFGTVSIIRYSPFIFNTGHADSVHLESVLVTVHTALPIRKANICPNQTPRPLPQIPLWQRINPPGHLAGKRS